MPFLVHSAVSIVYFDDQSNILRKDTADYLSRLTSYTKTLRKEREVLLLNGGNAFFPSKLSKIDSGRHMIVLNKMMDVGLLSLYNRDLVHGTESLTKNALVADFPMLTGDLRRADNLQPIEATIPIYERKFGGLTTVIASSYMNTKFIESPINTTSLVTVNPLTDSDPQTLLSIAQADFKLLLTTNVNILPPAYTQMFDAVITQPVYEVTHALDKTVFGPRGSNALVVHIDDYGDYTYEYIDVRSYPKNPLVDRLIARYQALFESDYEVPLVTFDVPISTRMKKIRSQENILGNAMTDAMRKDLNADVAVLNSGAIRGHHIYEQGHSFTYIDLYNELPFDHDIYLVTVTGKMLRLMMENSLSILTGYSGRFLQFSGMQVTYEKSKPVGNRVISISVNGRPLVDSTTYKLAINDYMLGGGDGYKMFEHAVVERQVSPQKTSDIVIKYLSDKTNLGEIRAPRLIAVSAK